MNTVELENVVIKLLDVVGLSYADLTPYQKEVYLTILEDFVDGLDVLSEKYDEGWERGFQAGVDDEREESAHMLDAEYDKGYEKGYKEGYDEGIGEFSS